MQRDTFTSTPFTPPAVSLSNNAVNVVFDSTYGFIGVPSSTVVGPYRGRYSRVRIIGWIVCATQNVTARLDYLTAAGAWVTGAKSQAVAAATDQPIDWVASSTDWRLVIVNGATGPSALTLNGFHLTNNPDSGG
jgi:hypothetical protein